MKAQAQFQTLLVQTDSFEGIQICLLVDAKIRHINAAYAVGYDIVAYTAKPKRNNKGEVITPRGIVRHERVATRVNLAQLVRRALDNVTDAEVRHELEAWNQHLAGTKVGLSDKANSPQLANGNKNVFFDAVYAVINQL